MKRRLYRLLVRPAILNGGEVRAIPWAEENKTGVVRC